MNTSSSRQLGVVTDVWNQDVGFAVLDTSIVRSAQVEQVNEVETAAQVLQSSWGRFLLKFQD